MANIVFQLELPLYSDTVINLRIHVTDYTYEKF